MKKIGLVGGTGPESTIMYYKKLNTEIDKLTEGKAMPDIAIESVNFRRAWDYVSNAKYDSLTDYLAEKVNCLISGGAEVVSLTAITMHMVFEELEIGIIKESTLAELVDIINGMKEKDGIEGIILGCTELPLILNSDNCPVECFDAVDIHLKKLISLAMEG